MVKNHYTRQLGGDEPLDESWWAALLAEEERQYSPAGQRDSVVIEGEGKKAPAPSKPDSVDWERARVLFDLDETICLEVNGYNRGGLLVDGEGLHGFVPVSHLVDISCESSDEVREAALEAYIGRTLCLKVIECDPARGRVVFSERAAQAESGKRIVLLECLNPGECVEGLVTNVTDFGVFVDLGGIEGLIHVSELSWGRVRHPSDAVKVGQQVRAYIISMDKERSRIALSLKRLCPNPWETAEDRYVPGQFVRATITSVVPFGVFARLEEGLDGLVHISEMGIDPEKSHPDECFFEGQEIQARVLHVDASKQRLGLSLNLE